MDIAEINRRCQSGESFLMASDGQYLGKLCLNKFDVESIVNEYGAYGSRYSGTSIYNQYSMYGSQYSSLSPFNLWPELSYCKEENKLCSPCVNLSSR